MKVVLKVLKDALFLFATLLFLGFVLVYLPLGLVAAITQDSPIVHPPGPGEPVLPLPVRLFWFFHVWILRLLPLLAVPVAIHTALRRLIRPGISYGDSLLWDVLLSPLATAPAFVLVALALLFAAQEYTDPVIVLGVTTFVIAAFLAAGGLSLGLVIRWRLARRVALALLALLGLAPIARLVADAWGNARMAEYDRSWEKEVAAERQRLAAFRSPVLRDPVLDENAAPRYWTVSESVASAARQSSDYTQMLARAAGAGAEALLEPKTLRLLGERREDVRQLREAVHCNRCNWELNYERLNDPEPSRVPWRILINLVVLEGYEHEQAGDVRGAAERYLDVVRFSSDFRENTLIGNLAGIGLGGEGVKALGRLVVSDRPGVRPPLAQIRSELAKLEGHLPTVVTGFRYQRLRLGHLRRVIADRPEAIGIATPWILPGLVPYRALAAQAVGAADPMWREFERYAATEDPKKADSIAEALGARPVPHWNPIFRAVGPGALLMARSRSDDLVARFRLVQAAVALEETYGARRHYPPDAPSLDLPVDPYVPPARLRYQPTAGGTGYKLWSAGTNRRDDGGRAENGLDIVLERKGVAR